MKNLTLNDVLKQNARNERGIGFPLINLPANLAWTFGGLTARHTSYVSHGYHRYPAKFIPQLTRKVIEQYSAKEALICDPFMGSGTTILEALLAKRKVIGTDINPVAVLITQAKLRPFPPEYLQEQTSALLRDMNSQIAEEVHQQLPLTKNTSRVDYLIPENKRLVYWYPVKEIRQELAIILAHINRLADSHLKRYFQCAFSHILKNTSIWLNKSTKPTRDLKKSVPLPLKSFTRHVRKMNNRNRKLYFLMDPLIHERLDEYARVANGDARCQQSADNMVDLVVTSPPYVTSYEYADLHQLTALWFAYTDSVSEFRQNFIGSACKREPNRRIFSGLADSTIAELTRTAPRQAKGVESYFLEMQECFIEMRRILKNGGKTAIVIGNTALKGVPILNAEIFIEILEKLDFQVYDIIKRMIPAKILPQTRDKKTGRFASKKSSDTAAYPHEFIIIMEKLGA